MCLQLVLLPSGQLMQIWMKVLVCFLNLITSHWDRLQDTPESQNVLTDLLNLDGKCLWSATFQLSLQPPQQCRLVLHALQGCLLQVTKYWKVNCNPGLSSVSSSSSCLYLAPHVLPSLLPEDATDARWWAAPGLSATVFAVPKSFCFSPN